MQESRESGSQGNNHVLTHTVYLEMSWKGLANVIQELFPGVEHRNCARHIHANWSKQHRGKVFKKHFWQCAKSTNDYELQENLKALEKRDVAAREDLDKYPLQFWCKVYFRTAVKCDIVDNNLSEAFNNTLVAARSKPIILMLEEIRKAVMKRIAKKKASVEKWNGDFGPLIMKKLNQSILTSADWEVDFNGDDGYEVRKGKLQYKVSLEHNTCSCRGWDLSGIPCPHAVCAIFNNGRQPEEFIHYYYKKDQYLKTYAHTIQPINGSQLWPTTQGEEILAPVPKKMSGRPKKKRTKEVGESQKKTSKSKTKLTRKGLVMTCKNCNQEGHNIRKCKQASQKSPQASQASQPATQASQAPQASQASQAPQASQASQPSSLPSIQASTRGSTRRGATRRSTQSAQRSTERGSTSRLGGKEAAGRRLTTRSTAFMK